MKLLDYIGGAKKGKDAHRIEREAMQDPFLRDALDGFDAIKGNHLSNIVDIQAAILSKHTQRKRSMWIISICAASFLGIILLSTYFILNSKENQPTSPDNNTFLYVYAPESFVNTKRFNPSKELVRAQIDNLHTFIMHDTELEIFVPETYIEQRNSELTLNSANLDIVLDEDELFASDEFINIYVPYHEIN